MVGRALDRALRASDQRHQAFTRELAERHQAATRELDERRERFEREMEQRYREQVQISREVIRRNELIMSRLVEKVERLTEDSRAQTKAILQVLDRLQNGGDAATS